MGFRPIGLALFVNGRSHLSPGPTLRGFSEGARPQRSRRLGTTSSAARESGQFALVPYLFSNPLCLRTSVMNGIGEEPAKAYSKAPIHPKPSLPHRVKPLLTLRKSPNCFRLLGLHGLYVHICIPKFILFAHCSPDTAISGIRSRPLTPHAKIDS